MVSYRPVGILSCISKIFESILIDQLHSILVRLCQQEYLDLEKDIAAKLF